MSSKLEILSQVMLSLKLKQSKSMYNINSLLSNANTEIDLIDKVEDELEKLSSIHLKMQECESFMLQISGTNLKNQKIEDNKTDSSNTI